MPLLDISDHAFVALAPPDVRAREDGPCALSGWVPGLRLQPVLDRGAEGTLWRAAAVDPVGARWTGTAEVWLQAWHDGTVVHVHLRLDPAERGVGPDREHDLGHTLGNVVTGRAATRWRESFRDRWRTVFLAWRRRVDAHRPPGAAAGRPGAGTGQTAAS